MGGRRNVRPTVRLSGATDTHVLRRGVQMLGVMRINDHPSAIATADLDEIVRFPGESDGFSEISLDFADERDVGAIVLQAAAEHPAVALRDTDIVKHAHREAIA